MFEELLRTDPSSHVFGLRLNFWVALVCFLVSASFFVYWQFLRDPERAAAPRIAGDRPGKAAPTRKPGPKMAVPKGRVR